MNRAMIFFTDTSNILECRIEVNGASLDNTKVRLVMEMPEGYFVLYPGTVDPDGMCKIRIPPLKKEGNFECNATLEAISESTFFEPWKSTIEFKERKKVTVEVFDNSTNDVSIQNEGKSMKVEMITSGPAEQVQTKSPQPIYEQEETYVQVKNLLEAYKAKNPNASKDDVIKNAKALLSKQFGNEIFYTIGNAFNRAVDTI
jgi:hypothetical protein